jgi:hypothetical protein
MRQGTSLSSSDLARTGQPVLPVHEGPAQAPAIDCIRDRMNDRRLGGWSRTREPHRDRDCRAMAWVGFLPSLGTGDASGISDGVSSDPVVEDHGHRGCLSVSTGDGKRDVSRIGNGFRTIVDWLNRCCCRH